MSCPPAPRGWERDVCCGGSWEVSFSTPNSFLPLLPDVAVSQDCADPLSNFQSPTTRIGVDRTTPAMTRAGTFCAGSLLNKRLTLGFNAQEEQNGKACVRVAPELS